MVNTKVTDQEIVAFNKQCKMATNHIWETLKKKFISYGKDSLLIMKQQGVADTVKMKATRLINILETGNELEDNNIEDSWRDLAGWSVLGLMLYWKTYPGQQNANNFDHASPSKKVKLVYLAGPIDLCTKEESRDWRKEAINGLNKAGIATFCPAHAFNWSGNTDGAEKVININEIALRSSDAVLINLPEGVQTVGTLIELKMANDLKKHIVIRTDIKKSLYLEPYIKEETLEKAIEKVISLNE